METLAFTFGVLSTVAVILVAVLVWGIVKVIKQQKQLVELELSLSNIERNLYESIDLVRNDVDIRFKEVYSYTDSRIDKCKETNKKQTLNG
jgi:cell shape-determining protein MreC